MSDERTIWVGNLSQDVSEAILYELFLQGGPLERVNIPKTSDGRPRPFGFVTYNHQVSVPYALEIFKGICLFDRTIKMQSRAANQTPPIPKMNSTPPCQNNSIDERPRSNHEKASRSNHEHTPHSSYDNPHKHVKSNEDNMLPYYRSIGMNIFQPNLMNYDNLIAMGSHMLIGSPVHQSLNYIDDHYRGGSLQTRMRSRRSDSDSSDRHNHNYDHRNSRDRQDNSRDRHDSGRDRYENSRDRHSHDRDRDRYNGRPSRR